MQKTTLIGYCKSHDFLTFRVVVFQHSLTRLRQNLFMTLSPDNDGLQNFQ